MTARLPHAFHNPPKDPLEIRRVPPEIQDGASNGYYRPASLDGSRPAIYFINLKSTGDWPKYSLPALTYHEGNPGHHLQNSVTQGSGDIPMLRRIAFYSAYGEGWALYAEQVADELGAYKGIERAGYLQSFLFRAERLVVDTGLNHKRWTREQAIDHMVAATGFARPRVQREIERYCASPGQACSYKIGHIAWTRARAKAQTGARREVRPPRLPRHPQGRRDAADDLRAAGRRADQGEAGGGLAGELLRHLGDFQPALFGRVLLGAQLRRRGRSDRRTAADRACRDRRRAGLLRRSDLRFQPLDLARQPVEVALVLVD